MRFSRRWNKLVTDGALLLAVALGVTGQAAIVSAQTPVGSPAMTPTGWREETPIPVARSEFAAATIGTDIYVAGGFESDGRVDRYDTTTGEWHDLAPSLKECITPESPPSTARSTSLGGITWMVTAALAISGSMTRQPTHGKDERGCRHRVGHWAWSRSMDFSTRLVAPNSIWAGRSPVLSRSMTPQPISGAQGWRCRHRGSILRLWRRMA